MINNEIRFRNRLVPLFFFFIFLCSCGYGQTTFIKHFTTKDGLPSNNCYYTLQDTKGYIWVASDAGVSRFDGKNFENFSIEDGLPDNQIIRLFEDRSGKIWFSALNGELSYFYNGKIFNAQNDKLLKILKFSGVIVSFFEDSKGNLWLGTNKNILAKWDGRSLKKYTSANDSNQFINTFIYEDRAGRVWACSAHCSRVFNGSEFTHAARGIDPISYKTTLNNKLDKTIFFLDKNGLNIKDGSTQQLILKIDENLLNDNPGYFYATHSKEVWLSTNSGVYHLEGDKKTTHYLRHTAINQVIKDSKDNMWFTTAKGIYLLSKKENRIYVIDGDNGLSNKSVQSLLKDSTGKLWLGLDNGMLNILKNPGYAVTTIDLPDQRKFGPVKQLSLDPGGKSILFASDNGLGILSNPHTPDQQINYLRETDNSGFVLKNFSISKNNQLALALSSGVVILNDPAHNLSFTSSAYKEGKNFFSSRSYCVFYDKDQNLWFSNLHGLSELSGDKMYRYYLQHPLLTKRINDIAQTPDGTVVLATDGYGLLFFKNHKLLKQLTRKNGLASNICRKLFIQKDHIWVITNNGLNRVFSDKQYAVETFEYTDDLLAGDVNDLYIDADTAYFATNHGLVYFRAAPYDSKKEAPKVLISSISSNDVLLNTNSAHIILTPGYNNIVFRYSAIDFQNKDLLYRYRLKTTDNWTETKSRRLAFSSLEPGEYVFELCTRTSNSEWSKPVKVSFRLIGNFWQSAYFMLLILLVASLTFYKIAVVVTKQQKNKEQQQLLLRNKILMLEQRALQAMMNPHFVFNIMNSIQHYINTKDTSSANKILTGFAKLIRKNLDICTRSFITLEEELEYLTLYLNLEKKRFGERFNYHISIEEDIDQDETLIPSMLLQPYIENAIWHGLMPKEDDSGKIDIVITKAENDALLIKIIDDGIGINNSLRIKKDGHESKGMSLTQERVNLINQTEANPIQIEIAQNGNSGTTISILIPNR